MALPIRRSTTAPSYTAPRNTGVLAQVAKDPTSYNLNKATGPLATASTWKPMESELASGRLDKMLQSDNPYITRARSRAAEVAAGRGLLNSSLAAGAGEAAAIDSAGQFALADSQTLARAGEFNANSKNTFGLQSNDIRSQNARTQYQGILSMAQQNQDLGLEGAKLGVAEDQFNRQHGLDERKTDLQNEQFNKTFGLDERRVNSQNDQFDRTFGLDERRFGEDRRQFDENTDLERDRLNEQTNAADSDRRAQTADTVARMRQTAIDSMRALESDPNMSRAAKRTAINNILTATRQNIEEYVKFSGIDLPDAWPSFMNNYRVRESATEEKPDSKGDKKTKQEQAEIDEQRRRENDR